MVRKPPPNPERDAKHQNTVVQRTSAPSEPSHSANLQQRALQAEIHKASQQSRQVRGVETVNQNNVRLELGNQTQNQNIPSDPARLRAAIAASQQQVRGVETVNQNDIRSQSLPYNAPSNTQGQQQGRSLSSISGQTRMNVDHGRRSAQVDTSQPQFELHSAEEMFSRDAQSQARHNAVEKQLSWKQQQPEKQQGQERSRDNER